MRINVVNLGQMSFLSPPWSVESTVEETPESRRRRMRPTGQGPFIGPQYVTPLQTVTFPIRMSGRRALGAKLGQYGGCVQTEPASAPPEIPAEEVTEPTPEAAAEGQLGQYGGCVQTQPAAAPPEIPAEEVTEPTPEASAEGQLAGRMRGVRVDRMSPWTSGLFR